MKKRVSYLIVFLLLLEAGNAQRLQAGITGSMDLFSIKGDGMSAGLKPGYNAGLYVQWKLMEKWKLRSEVLFTQKNIEAAADFKEKFPQLALSSVQSAILLNAIAVPLLIDHSIGKDWSVQIGPQYMHVVDGDEKLLREGKTAFKKNEWSMIGGLQWQLTNALSLQGRYTYGLTNLNAISDDRTWKSRSISFGIGWRFL